MEYNYIDESLEEEMRKLEMPEDLETQIDKEYDLNFSDDEIFQEKEKEKEKDKYDNNILSPKRFKKTEKEKEDEEFDLYLRELQKKSQKEAQEELIKNQIDINLKRNNILINPENDEKKAIKLIEDDPYLKNAIENKYLSFDDICAYVDYYELFTFVNKTQKFTFDEFNKISDLCEKETFEENEEIIRNRIKNTLKITDEILNEDTFDAKKVINMEDKKNFIEEKEKEKLRKKNEKDFYYKKSETEKDEFLKDMINIVRNNHIEIDDVFPFQQNEKNNKANSYLNINEEVQIIEEEKINNKKNLGYSNINSNTNTKKSNNSNLANRGNKNKGNVEKDSYKHKDKDNDNNDNYDNDNTNQGEYTNKLNPKEVGEICENDKEYKFLEKINFDEQYLKNIKILENKDKNNSNRVFFVEKDLEDIENYKKGKVKNDNNYNEKSNPLHKLNAPIEDLSNSSNEDINEDEAEQNYKNLLNNLYKKHNLDNKNKYNNNNNNKIISNINKNIKDKKNKNNNNNNVNGNDADLDNENKSEQFSQTSGGFELNKKFKYNPKKYIIPIKGKENSNAIIKNSYINNNNNNNNNSNNLNSEINVNVNNCDIKSQISNCGLSVSNSIKDSISNASKFSKSIRSKLSSLSKNNNPKSIDLFTDDNKMTNLIKVREQRKEIILSKRGNKSNKRPDLFAFNTQHILINDKDDEAYDKIFEILQEEKKNSQGFSTKKSNYTNENNDSINVENSTDSINSKNSIRKKIEQAMHYSKKVY